MEQLPTPKNHNFKTIHQVEADYWKELAKYCNYSPTKMAEVAQVARMTAYRKLDLFCKRGV